MLVLATITTWPEAFAISVGALVAGWVLTTIVKNL